MSRTNKHKYNRRRKIELRNRARKQLKLETTVLSTSPTEESAEDALARMMERRRKL